ncbi:beta family protein, partial [Streptococcus sanguinis]|uniref:beta family protein n=1 Tax=Streptococcus sanguinis TaxID=1305 RepID=UPI001CBE5E19
KYPHPIWVDIRELQDFHKLPSIEQRIQENDEYIHAKIVYPLSYVLQHLVEPKHCVRFTPQDLSDDYSWLENYQHQLPHNILIDFGYISEIPNQNIKNNITKLINFLGNRNIVVASGSIPENLGISRTTNFNQPRYEKQFYQQLSAQSPTPIIYGDHGTVSPVSKLIDTHEIIVA